MAILSPAATADLRGAFEAADYRIDPAMAAIGAAGRAALARNHTVAAERALGERDDALATLTRLFVLQLTQPKAAVEAALPAAALLEAGLLAEAEGGLRATVDIRPYGGDDGSAGWIASDHAATLNTARGRPRPDHVLGLSPASVSLAQLTPRRPVGRALDLGTGCGVQSLHLARHARQVIATDVNPRALDLAGLTFGLSGVDVDLRRGSLYSPVATGRFDLIATNPPFVIAPPGPRRLAYRESSDSGDGLMRRVVTGAAAHLEEGGVLAVLGNWAHETSCPWEERLAGWIAAGCDALVVQRELLDPYEYAEIWLADAGLAGTPSYRRRYDRWLAYFDALGYTGVGLGWILVQRSGSAQPSIRCLDWPYAVQQPAAGDLMAQFDAVGPSRWPDGRFLAACWRLAADAYEESVRPPGAADPASLTLRRRRGLPTAVPVDGALAGVLGACDGDLPLQAILDAVASLTGEDPAALTGRLLPVLRELVATAWLTPDTTVASR
ncbi:MAG: class I SAM-dependent methyltransferase [Propionibacteriaceae bacterium]|jgi:methylase of polypeptide subunit release factors|nr:class I SAM-dependent methyltransferase [Propionibacteriaceae bacterium]